jgi:glucose/arabinose dehydrogenase
MRRTLEVLAVVAAVTVGAVAVGLSRDQGTPEATGTPSLQKYHITPGELPTPTDGVANPPEVVDKPADAELRLPPGFAIDVFAQDVGFQTLRNLMEAPNGDLFAADATANTITLLRDANNDGKVDERKVVASGLNRPYGMAISNGYFYVGNTDSVVRWKWAPGETMLAGTPEKIATLPGGGNHSTRSLAFTEDGSKLYVTIGSATNVDVEQGRALIRVMNPDGTGSRVFASGLRNPVGLAIRPGTNEVWAGVHERDMLGDNLVPDYVTRVQDGGFYGWPYSYIGQHEDPRRKGEQPELVKKAIVPDVLLQSHSAPMGLTFYTGTQFPADYRSDAFLAMHGSWNRKNRTGYKVVRILVRDGQPTGEYEDFIVGWSLGESQSKVWGRPVAIVVRKDGSMLITDDAHNVIWRVTYKG